MEGQEGGMSKGTRKLLGGMDMVTLFVVMGSQAHICQKVTNCTLKYIHSVNYLSISLLNNKIQSKVLQKHILKNNLKGLEDMCIRLCHNKNKYTTIH